MGTVRNEPDSAALSMGKTLQPWCTAVQHKQKGEGMFTVPFPSDRLAEFDSLTYQDAQSSCLPPWQKHYEHVCLSSEATTLQTWEILPPYNPFFHHSPAMQLFDPPVMIL